MADADADLDAFRRELADAERASASRSRSTLDDDRAPFVDDDGTPYVWDDALGRFVATVPDGSVGTVATAYDASTMTYDEGEDEDERNEIRRAVATFDAINADKRAEENLERADATTRKRLAATARAAERAKKAKAKREEAASASGFERVNASKASSAVYVEGLPSDATEEELFETFKKCGVVKLDARTEKPKVKVYRDESGAVKGDGLVVFLKPPSVDLAITLLDQTELRLGDASTKMTVSAAKFEAKRGGEGGGEGEDGGDAKGGAKKAMTKTERKRAAAILKRQEAQALGWSGFDDAEDAKKLIVVLRHMFTLEEMYSDVNLRKELEEDVVEEAQRTCGPVMSVRTYTRSKDGTMTVSFKTRQAAEACVAAWNGRWFDGRQIAASAWDGKTKIATEQDESDAAQRARLDAYAKSLGGDEGDDEGEEDEDEDGEDADDDDDDACIHE